MYAAKSHYETEDKLLQACFALLHHNFKHCERKHLLILNQFLRYLQLTF